MPSASIADRCDNQNVLRSDMLVLTEKTEAKACGLNWGYVRMGFVERLRSRSYTLRRCPEDWVQTVATETLWVALTAEDPDQNPPMLGYA